MAIFLMSLFRDWFTGMFHNAETSTSLWLVNNCLWRQTEQLVSWLMPVKGAWFNQQGFQLGVDHILRKQIIYSIMDQSQGRKCESAGLRKKFEVIIVAWAVT